MTNAEGPSPADPGAHGHLDDEQLADLVDSELTSTDNRLHLDACTTCHGRYEAQLRIRAMVATAVPLRPVDDVNAAISSAMQPSTVIAYDPARSRKNRKLRRFRVASIAAVALVGGGFIATQVQESNTNTPTRASQANSNPLAPKASDNENPSADAQSGKSTLDAPGPVAGRFAAPLPSANDPTGVAALRGSATKDALKDPCNKVIASAPVSMVALNGITLSYQGEDAIAFFNNTDRLVVATRSECNVIVDAKAPR